MSLPFYYYTYYLSTIIRTRTYVLPYFNLPRRASSYLPYLLPDLWMAAWSQGAELVLWPAAAKGAHPVDGYAQIYNISSPPMDMGNSMTAQG